MSIEFQCMTEKLIVISIKLDNSKVPSKSIVPTYAPNSIYQNYFLEIITIMSEKKKKRSLVIPRKKDKACLHHRYQ